MSDWNPFASKTVTVIGTSVSRLIEDDLLPNSVVSGMLRAVLQNTDIPSGIFDELTQSIAARAEAMYGYSQGDYVFGSPSGDYLTNAQGASEVAEILATLEGAPVTLEYTHCGPPNILHIGWFKLVRDYGYDPLTNKIASLSAIKGADVFVHDIIVEVPTGTLANYSELSLDQWGPAPQTGVSPTRPAMTPESQLQGLVINTPPTMTADAEDAARVVYAWRNPSTGVVQQESIRITNAEYDEAEAFMQVKYRVGGLVKYWIYQLGDGTYPQLDGIGATPSASQGNYFPFIHFRRLRASLGANPESDEYKHSVKMAKKAGFDYDTMLDAIHENEGVGEVEQAFIAMMVPATATSQIEMRYLFDFYDRMFEAGRELNAAEPVWPPVTGLAGALIRNFTLPYRYMEVIQDTGIRLVVGNSGIQKAYLPGNIGEVGSHQSGRFEYAPEPGGVAYANYFRRQITPNVYIELRVINSATWFHVFGDYYASSSDDEEVSMIPLDRSITRTYSLSEREQLYARSLHLVCNSKVEIVVKWYQRPEFGQFLQALAVFMFIVSLGSSSYVSAALLQAGSALSIALAVLTALVIELLTNLALVYVFKLVAKELGTDLALLLAVVAAVAAAYKGFSAGGLENSLPAQAALNVSTGLVKGVAANTMDALKDIQQEMREFQDGADQQLKLLEETQKLLDSSSKLDPLVVFGESPDEYYNRTVHPGNIGTIGFTALHNFVDMSVRLPTLADTAEGF